ncbi:hypothetical protein M3A49_10630 [Paraburkholderia sp. CNPSo 3076]|uniref:hypothetical protein n=1 Tax=Paraburkholderia sp. CNPSo 3076 TaxID=2940936 RepID=UPI00224FD40F|nr:hypothetical protein [Paraburkholderia sp. CNPSo 3076]MCX5539947.1 hypothetical protein [Paraburkholderia sp. CNPSo 3076]
MSAQIARDQSFPTPCKLCGGVLYQQIDSCPYCGADRPLDTAARVHPKAASRAHGPMAVPMPAVAKLSPAGASASNRPSVHADYLHHYELEYRRLLRHTGRQRFTKGLLLVSLILAIACAAFVLFGERHKQEGPREARSTTYSTDGSVPPYSPHQQTNVMPPAADTGPQFAAPKPGAIPHFKDAQDIAARAQRRDDTLQSADRCATQRAWACVQQQASEALAIDPGSLHARSLMERAILATGWSPLRSPRGAAQMDAAVPLPRDARTVPLPSSQDWAAATPSASKDPPASAPPPPLPGATNSPATVNPTDLGDANASATASAADESASTGAPGPPSNDNGADAQERAILQLGWKHAAPSEATH